MSARSSDPPGRQPGPLPGRLIVIEGADGTGKTTQLALLAERLRAAGHAVATYDFPSKAGTPIGELIGEFLRGGFGRVVPEFLSLAFSIDRLTRRSALVADLAAGRTVLCDRYVSSNIAFQGAKLDDPARREGLDRMLRWLEYDIFGLPRADLEIALVAEDSYFLEGRHLARGEDEGRAYAQGAADIHEAQTGLQLAVNAYYRGLAARPSARCLAIAAGGQRRAVGELAALIWRLVEDDAPELAG